MAGAGARRRARLGRTNKEGGVSIVLQAHGWLRWLVVAVLVVSVVLHAAVWLAGRRAGALERAVNGGVLGAIGLQLVLGVILLLGRHDGKALEHATVMVVAVALAHLALRWRALPEAQRARNLTLLHAGVLALVYVGVWRITGSARWLLDLAG